MSYPSGKEIDRSHRTITMLGYDEFCHILLFRIRIIVIVTIDEADKYRHPVRGLLIHEGR